MDNLFPIRVDGGEHGVYGYRGLFLSAKPADMSWYSFDVIIESPTEVTFVVFGMLDNLYGGVGPEKARFSAKTSKESTKHDIFEALKERAISRRERELWEAESNLISSYIEEEKAKFGV